MGWTVSKRRDCVWVTSLTYERIVPSLIPGHYLQVSTSYKWYTETRRGKLIDSYYGQHNGSRDQTRTMNVMRTIIYYGGNRILVDITWIWAREVNMSGKNRWNNRRWQNSLYLDSPSLQKKIFFPYRIPIYSKYYCRGARFKHFMHVQFMVIGS